MPWLGSTVQEPKGSRGLGCSQRATSKVAQTQLPQPVPGKIITNPELPLRGFKVFYFQHLNCSFGTDEAFSWVPGSERNSGLVMFLVVMQV